MLRHRWTFVSAESVIKKSDVHMSRLSCTFVAVYASVIIVHYCHCLGFYRHSPVHAFCALVLHWLTGGVGNGGRAIISVGFTLGSEVPFCSCRFSAQKHNNLPSAKIATNKYVQFYRLNFMCSQQSTPCTLRLHTMTIK